MADLPKEPIFFRDEHRAFLETRDADVLDWGVMRLNLYRLKTGMLFSTYWESWLGIIIYGTMGLGFISMGVGFLIGFGLEGINYLVQDGFPHWRLMIYALIVYGWFLAFMVIASQIGWAILKRAVEMLCWPDQRIASLVQRLAEDGRLVKGEIVTIGYRKGQSFATFHFTTPVGTELERDFLLNHYRDPAPGTPVWVLYLNDKISVLL